MTQNPDHIHIVSPDTYGIAEGIASASSRMGVSSTVYHYREPFRGLRRYFVKSSRPLFEEVMRNRVLPAMGGVGELLVVLKGDGLSPSVRTALKNCSVVKFLWIYDSFRRCPGAASILPLFDLRWFVDGADAARFTGDNERWTPLGFDETLFTAGGRPRDIDVLIFGSIGERYSRRRRVVEKISRSALPSRYRVCFVGTTGRRYRDAILRFGKGMAWLEKKIPIRDLALLMKRSKIVVNIHQDDGEKPVNPMFFAIPSTGACQVAEDREYLNEWMSAGEEFVPASEEEMIDALDYLLRHEQERDAIAHAGMAKVLSHYTMSCCIEKLFAAIDLDKDED